MIASQRQLIDVYLLKGDVSIYVKFACEEFVEFGVENSVGKKLAFRDIFERLAMNMVEIVGWVTEVQILMNGEG